MGARNAHAVHCLVCLRCIYLVAAAAALCAVVNASCGDLPPDSAAWKPVHMGWEIFGYFVPRLSLVRPLAALTASTHTFSSALAATCLVCTASVAAMYDSVVSVARALSALL